MKRLVFIREAVSKIGFSGFCNGVFYSGETLSAAHTGKIRARKATMHKQKRHAKGQKVFFGWLLTSIVLLNHTHAQQNESIDVGATLLTLNTFASRFYNAEKPMVEYPNGLFFRYNRNRFSMRTLGSYSQYKFESIDLSFNTRRTIVDIKDLRFGFGVQYTLAKKINWLYIFTDALYRHVSSYVITLTGAPTAVSEYNVDSNGIDSFLGLGSSVKIYEHFFLIQEIGFNARYERISYSSVNMISFPYGYWSSNLKPMFRLSLVYKLPKKLL